jgi:hypothetical protein
MVDPFHSRRIPQAESQKNCQNVSKAMKRPVISIIAIFE